MSHTQVPGRSRYGCKPMGEEGLWRMWVHGGCGSMEVVSPQGWKPTEDGSPRRMQVHGGWKPMEDAELPLAAGKYQLWQSPKLPRRVRGGGRQGGRKQHPIN